MTTISRRNQNNILYFESLRLIVYLHSGGNFPNFYVSSTTFAFALSIYFLLDQQQAVNQTGCTDLFILEKMLVKKIIQSLIFFILLIVVFHQ